MSWSNLGFYFEERIEGCTVEPLSKATDHKDYNISHMPGVNHQVHFILTVHNNLKSTLIISEQLHLLQITIMTVRTSPDIWT